MQNNRDRKMRILLPGSKLDRFLERQLSSTLFSYRQIFSMLFPLILDQFFINTISLLTTAMISSSSQESVTAVSLVAPLSMLLYAVFGSISVGGTVVVAQYMGRGDMEKIRSASGQILLSSLLLAAVSCLFLVLFSNPFIRLAFGSADPIVIEKASSYLIGVAISQIFLSVYMGTFAVFRGMGAAKVCLRLTIIINIIHLLASMIFLNVMKLDILGTALSLNLARFIGSIVAVYLLMKPNSMIRIHTRHIFLPNHHVDCPVGLGYFMSIRLGLGVQGVWISMGIEWAVRTLIFYLRYQSNVWLDKQVIG